MIRALALTLLLAACQSGPITPAETAGRCDFVVRFTSVCCGIDRETFASVTTFLTSDPRVGSVIERRWGREGEVDLCVAARPEGGQAVAFELLMAVTEMVPPEAEGTANGPVTVLIFGEDDG